MDVLFRGARVVDPDTGTDQVMTVGVTGDRITHVGPGDPPPSTTTTVLDASGLVLAPGFIDLHSHAQSPTGHRLQALDGVTTALDLESGALPVAAHYAEAEAEGRPLNFGFSASWALARLHVMAQVPLPRYAPGERATTPLEVFQRHQTDPRWLGPATPAQVDRVLDLLEGGVAEGALGIGVLLGYAPGSGREEYFRVAQRAEQLGVGVSTHARHMSALEPGSSLDGALEVIAAAAGTGAALHLCHVNSTSLRRVDQVGAALVRAAELGNRVTTEAYPYAMFSTGIGAAFLAPEHLGRLGVQPTDVLFLPTGERVRDAERLRELRATDPGGLCVVDFLDAGDAADQALLARAVSLPGAVVASDAMPLVRGTRYDVHDEWPVPPGAAVHPRSAGTFARALRWMVRERGDWTLLEAVERCSTGPARILEPWVPAMRRKGRVAVGCDADLVLLDLEATTDRASAAAVLHSSGVRHLLVGGEFVVRDGQLDLTALPGRPVRSGG